MLITEITAQRGLVRVSGTVPNGPLVVRRSSARVPTYTLRGGTKTVTTGGFTLEDTESPIGVPVTYTATSTPDLRLIQRNFVLTPNFARGIGSWTAGNTRTISSSGTVSPSTAVTTIAEVGIGTLIQGERYLITGKVRFRTPGVWTWQDVKNFGTWQNVKDAKANWAAVRSSVAVPDGDSYATLYIQVRNGASGTYTTPVQVFKNTLNSSGQWVTFSAYITAPAIGGAAGSRLRLLHGATTREYSITWDLDQFSLFTEEEANRTYRLFWFSGDTPVPARPQDYLMQNSDWEDNAGNASITWLGTPGNSISQFMAPTQIKTSKTITIDLPSKVPCEPVLLSDPVSSALTMWFGLAAVEGLSREARITVMSVLGRSDFVATTTTRGSAKSSIKLYTTTLDERTQALSLFESGRVLLLRNPNPAYPETSWYIACGDIEEERTFAEDARKPERTWTVPFVQVERPTGLIEASGGVTWQMIKDSGMTWGQLRDARDNWLEVLLETP